MKFVRKYLDDIRSTAVRHASKIRVKTGVTKGGKIVALHVNALFDGGAYAAGKVIPTILPGPETKFPYGDSEPASRAHGGLYELGAGRLHARAGRHPMRVRRRVGDRSRRARTRHRAAGIPHAQLRARRRTRRRGPLVLGGARRRSARTCSSASPAGARRCRPAAAAASRSPCGTSASGKSSLNLLLMPNGNIEVHTGTTEQGMGILTVLESRRRRRSGHRSRRACASAAAAPT